MVIAVDAGPPGGHAVHQAFAGFQLQVDPPRRSHGEDRALGRQGGVGMPDMAAIEGQQLFEGEGMHGVKKTRRWMGRGWGQRLKIKCT